ncbi:MAG: hypothetical protein AAF307_07040 [Pseudomonadota bacterium]
MFSVLFLCAACTTQSMLDDLLTEALPNGAEARIFETCAPFMGGAVALLDEVLLPDEELHEPRDGEGKWTRSLSLSSFVEADSAQYRVAGVAATLLDGKSCYRKISPKADEVLFGERSGRFYRSENREIIIVIFDAPAGEGVMFVQAP